MFGEPRTSSITNLFGVVSVAFSVGSFWNRTDGVWSENAKSESVGGLRNGANRYSGWLCAALTQPVNQHSVWEGET